MNAYHHLLCPGTHSQMAKTLLKMYAVSCVRLWAALCLLHPGPSHHTGACEVHPGFQSVEVGDNATFTSTFQDDSSSGDHLEPLPLFWNITVSGIQNRTWQRRFGNGTVVSGVTLVNVQPPCQQYIGIILFKNGEMCPVATLNVTGTVKINNDGKGEVFPKEQSVRQGDSATFKCRIPADKCQTLNLTWKILATGQVMWHQSTEMQRGEGFIFSTVTLKNVHGPTLATSFIKVNCYLHRAQNTSTFVAAALLKLVDQGAKEHHWKEAVITLSCGLVLGVFIYIILIKYRFVWPDIPDPKNCSWAKGIDFSKPGNSNDWWKFHQLPATKPESFVPITEEYYTSVHNIEIHVDGDVSCITQYRDVADNTTHVALPQSVIYTLVVSSNGSLLSEDEPKLLGNELCKTGSEVNDAPACSNFIIPSYLKQNLDKIIT